MIEYRTNGNDQRYFTWNGRHLCSSRDPEKEARDWVVANAKSLETTNQVVVLGLGVGYHVVELQKKYPTKSVCVIESHSEFICPALGLHEEAFRAEVLLCESVSIFKAQTRLRSLFQSSFVVICYPPAWLDHRSIYQDIRELLICRTLSSLQFQLQKRAELGRTLRIDIKKLSETPHLLSVKDLEAALDHEGTAREEAHLISALRELLV